MERTMGRWKRREARMRRRSILMDGIDIGVIL
jgi:hypothetical protein